MRLPTPRLTLLLEDRVASLARIEAMPPADRAEFRPHGSNASGPRLSPTRGSSVSPSLTVKRASRWGAEFKGPPDAAGVEVVSGVITHG